MVMAKIYPLFSVIGIELEYMLVDQTTLDISPHSDNLLEHLAGKLVNETTLDNIAISNELVLHVIELKNYVPIYPDKTLVKQFQKTLATIQAYLNTKHMTLLPTAAHPWMNPTLETKRWIHGDQIIYQTYDKIFNCKGHGWANLQSVHVNLPFANDAEFSSLHSSIRLLLPLLPALAASSPIDRKS